MSTTYIAAIVSILATVLPRFGVSVSSEELTNILSALLVVGSGVWVIVQRYKRGDVTPIGVRK